MHGILVYVTTYKSFWLLNPNFVRPGYLPHRTYCLVSDLQQILGLLDINAGVVEVLDIVLVTGKNPTTNQIPPEPSSWRRNSIRIFLQKGLVDQYPLDVFAVRSKKSVKTQ